MHRFVFLAITAAAVTTASSLSAQVVTLEFIAQGNMWQADISETGSVVYERSEGNLTRLFRYTDSIGEERLDIGEREDVSWAKINSAGQVIFRGTDENQPAALRYSDGRGVEVLGPPNTRPSTALAINDAGQVTGSAYLNAASSGVYRYTDGTGMEFIDLGAERYVTARGRAINNSGMVAGSAEPHSGRDQVAFRYSDAEGVEFLGDLGGSMWVNGMNNQGDVVGFGELPDGLSSRFYLYTDDEGLTDIGGDGYRWQVFDINDDQWIVGMDFGNIEALLWTPSEGWLRLGSLLPPGLNADLYTAMGINNAGQIVGNGIINGEFGVYRITIHSIPTPHSLGPLVLIGCGCNRRPGRPRSTARSRL